MAKERKKGYQPITNLLYNAPQKSNKYNAWFPQKLIVGS